MILIAQQRNLLGFLSLFGDVILEQRVTDAKSKLLQSIRNNVHKNVTYSQIIVHKNVEANNEKGNIQRINCLEKW